MTIEEKKQQFLLRDRVIRVLSEDGFFRVAVVKNSKAARTAQEKHNLGSVDAIFLARQLAATSMMSSFLKGEERIIMSVESQGKIRKIYSEALQVGEVRGFIDCDNDLDEFHANSLIDYFSSGTINVTKILYSRPEPVSGISTLVNGDLAIDLAHYFRQSEQTITGVILDASIDNDGIILQSGGILAQAMPGASPDDIKRIYDKITSIGLIANLFENNETPLNIVERILVGDFKELNNTPLDFYCRCSKQSFMEKLLTLGLDEIYDIKKKAENELVCRYCNAKYYLEDADFTWLIESLKAKNN